MGHIGRAVIERLHFLLEIGLDYLSLLRNSGAAFSFGQGYTWVFPLITVAESTTPSTCQKCVLVSSNERSTSS